MLDTKNIEQLIHRIISGKLIFIYEDVIYELRKPSLQLKLKADLIYKESYDSNMYGNFWLIEDIPNLAIDIGILDMSYKQELTSLEKKLDSHKLNLYKEFFKNDRKKANKRKIDDTKRSINNLYNKIHYLDYLSLEHYCDKIKNEFLIVNTLHIFDTNKLVFDIKNIDYNIFNTLMTKISDNIISIDNYKQIARSDYWKNLWNNNKYNILSDSVSEWSDEQKTIFSISSMYDRVHEHPEAPEPDIIEDDDALDGWMIYQREQNNKQKHQKGVDTMLSDKVRNSSEIFLMPSQREEIGKIQELNSPESRNNVQQKFDYILNNKDREIKEFELPDVKDKLRQQMQEITKRG